MVIRDLFYPLVGLENHVGGHAFRWGIWVDGSFSWIGDDDWDIQMKYLPETLVSKCSALNRKLGIEFEVNDAVHSFHDLYLRKIAVKNMVDSKRDVQSFLFTGLSHLW